MKHHSTDAADAVLLRGLALALHDPSQGRAELHQAAAYFCEAGRGRLLSAAALVVFIGIADDDYTGFEAAAAVLQGAAAQTASLADPGEQLLFDAGSLIAGWFAQLDDAGLAHRAERIVQGLANAGITIPLRCCAGLAVMGYHHARMDLESVLFVELAMRPLLADPQLPPRLADEAHHLLVQALYECELPARAAVLRTQRLASGRPMQPAIELKLHLLDAQMALGSAHAETGAVALARAEPLLDPRAPRPASWWHLLTSRLALLQGRQRDALTHARLALRLGSASRLPERWMGVTVMQEGQVLVASGACADAVPFFERAGRAASGPQAGFCWCLADLARALHDLNAGDVLRGRQRLASGLALARRLAWFNFFRPSPAVAATVCAWALEHGVEPEFVREVIAARDLQAVRPDLAAWPWPIRVRTFGGLRIELAGQTLAFKGKVARRPLELLLFVIASGGADVSAATVAFALWRDLDGDKARSALNAALHRLRKLLGSDDALLLEHGRLRLNPQLVWVDCLAFEQLADSVGLPSSAVALPAALRAAAERAQALYTGPFLQDSEDQAWQLIYRSRLAGKFRRMLTLLAHAARARGDGSAARLLLERGLEFDPLAEDLARDLMHELMASGEQAAALGVFERCTQVIAQRLGARPAPATVALAAQIRGASS